MPSSCEFLAIIRRKEETKRLKQLELLFRVFKRSYNVTMVQSISPTSFPSPSQKKCQLLIITESQATLSVVIYLLPYFSYWVNAFKGKTSNVVIFEKITDLFHRFFFLIYYNSFYFCLQSCKSHLQENEKSMCTMGQFSGTDSLLLKDKSSSCSLDLIDLVM